MIDSFHLKLIVATLIIGLIVIILVISFIAAEELEVVEGCNLRVEPHKDAKIIDWVEVGDYCNEGEYCDYWKVHIKDYIRNLEYKGWVWTYCIKEDKIGYYISCEEGVSIRSNSTKKSKILGWMGKGSIILKVCEKKISWYRIKYGDKIGWIYAGYVKGPYCEVRIKSFEETLWEEFNAK